MRLRAACAQRPKRGEQVCGDAVLIVQAEPCWIIVADGLGHGPEARLAATGFTKFAADNLERTPAALIEAASRAIASTRGAAVMVARFDCTHASLLVAGVGNIELKCLTRSSVAPISSAGIVGRPLRSIREVAYPILAGDLFVFTSDGISRRADFSGFARLGVEHLAETILREHGQDHDDATCVVVRVEGT